MVKYIYGGNHSFLVLHDFLDKLARTPLRVSELHNDRYSYFLTFQHWALNFDAQPRRGDPALRRIQLPALPSLSVGRGL